MTTMMVSIHQSRGNNGATESREACKISSELQNGPNRTLGVPPTRKWSFRSELQGVGLEIFTREMGRHLNQ